MLNTVFPFAARVLFDVIDVPTLHPIIDPEPPSPASQVWPVYLAIGIAAAAFAVLIFTILRIRKNRRSK